MEETLPFSLSTVGFVSCSDFPDEAKKNREAVFRFVSLRFVTSSLCLHRLGRFGMEHMRGFHPDWLLAQWSLGPLVGSQGLSIDQAFTCIISSAGNSLNYYPHLKFSIILV